MGDMELQLFADRLRELRTKKNLTQAQFVDGLGITASALSAYEKNLKNPSISVAKRIADKYHVSIDWLCGLSDKTNDEDAIKTYADLIKTLLNIQSLDLVPMSFALRAFDKYNSSTEKYETWAGLLIDDEKIYHIMQDILKMQNVLNDGTINHDIYNTWLDGFLEKYNTPLTTWDSISFHQKEDKPEE